MHEAMSTRELDAPAARFCYDWRLRAAHSA
jgi:hypothetical protein